MIDFQGGRLPQLPKNTPVELVISTSHGKIQNIAVRPVVESDQWRGSFDLITHGSDPVDLRCYLSGPDGR